MTKKKIAIYYPYFAGGGAEAVGLWMLETLKDDYDLTLFTFSEPDFQKLNSLYETNLSRDSIKVNFIFPRGFSYFADFCRSNNEDFRKIALHSILAKMRSKKDDYDLLMSGYNAVDLGKKGIQYIHWVKVVEGGKKFYHKIFNFSEQQLKENISVVNSYQVAQIVKKTYGIDSRVIYPPVMLKNCTLSRDKKEQAFVCSGRLLKAKQPHQVIQILKKVRQQGFDVKLYFTGGAGGVYELGYRQFLQKMIDANSAWIKLYENLSYENYTAILSKCRYGIHYKAEPFGISIAEMIKAGLIPFVRKRGGQVEIVKQENTDLFFDNQNEAVEKIIQVLSDQKTQARLLTSLQAQKKLFSTEIFSQGIKETVTQYFQQN